CSQYSHIVPYAWRGAVPYRAPFQPGSRKPRKCSPARKWVRQPGGLSSARTYQGRLTAATRISPFAQGSTWLIEVVLRVRARHTTTGAKLNTPARGPLARRAMARPKKNP